MTGTDRTYRESCIVCFGGTDTGLAVHGPADAAVALLTVLGVPYDEAKATVVYVAESELGCEAGTVPANETTWPFRLCQRCAAPLEKNGMTVGLVAEGVPVYEAPKYAK